MEWCLAIHLDATTDSMKEQRMVVKTELLMEPKSEYHLVPMLAQSLVSNLDQVMAH